HPLSIFFMPVEGGLSSLLLNPNPTIRMPVLKIPVTARFNKLEKLPVGDQAFAYLIVREIYFVSAQFVVVAKPFTFKSNFVDSFFYRYKGFSLWLFIGRHGFIFIIGRKQRIVAENIFNIGKQQLLMMLCIVIFERSEKCSSRG